MVKLPPVRVTLGAIWTLTRRTVRDAGQDRVFGLAAEIAYYTLCALPPTALALLGVAGYVAQLLGPDTTRQLVAQLLDAAGRVLAPGTVAQVVKPAVETVVAQGRADVFSIGLLAAIWSASSSAQAVIDALIIAYDVEAKRTILRARLQAIGFALVGLVGSALLLPLVVAGPQVGAALAAPLGLADRFATAWRVLYWPVSALVSVLLLTTLYHFAIPWKTPFRRDLPGAVLALGLWLLAAAGLRRYVLWTFGASSVYGSLGAPIAVLLWLYVTALAILMGAELNAEIEKMWPTVTRARANLAEGIPDSVAAPPPSEAAPSSAAASPGSERAAGPPSSASSGLGQADDEGQ